MSENIINEEELNEEITDKTDSQTDELSEVEALKEELDNQKEQYLRLFAEFDNFKKRTAKERLDFFKTANSETILALLPVLDDFERAIKEIGKSDDNELLKGIELIQNKLIETLRSKGLKKIEIETGDDFDVETMEAVAQIPAPEENLQGKVVDVVQTGYSLTDKVIRHAKVVVGQ
ncbi:MAG: nucleotide exchange factor GrpE [Flavobacteriia bacterium]|nr:nucleotide exchange factor GrpE [Flavobacteriia bacterium]